MTSTYFEAWGRDQYTSSGIQYYHVSKIKQYGWLIYSWIINEFQIEVYVCLITVILIDGLETRWKYNITH
jgi:hypothetical protein